MEHLNYKLFLRYTSSTMKKLITLAAVLALAALFTSCKTLKEIPEDKTSAQIIQMGQNYVRGLFALGFQGFLIMVCVAIYAALISSVAFSTDIVGSMWGVLGYTVLLCFSLLKTSSISKSIFNAR